MHYEKDMVILDETPGLGADVDATFLEKCPRTDDLKTTAQFTARGESPARCRAADFARDRGGETTSIE